MGTKFFFRKKHNWYKKCPKFLILSHIWPCVVVAHAPLVALVHEHVRVRLEAAGVGHVVDHRRLGGARRRGRRVGGRKTCTGRLKTASTASKMACKWSLFGFCPGRSSARAINVLPSHAMSCAKNYNHCWRRIVGRESE